MRPCRVRLDQHPPCQPVFPIENSRSECARRLPFRWRCQRVSRVVRGSGRAGTIPRMTDPNPAQRPTDPPNRADLDETAQPPAEDGVEEDMSTLALHPGVLGQGLPADRPASAVDMSPERARERAAAIARGDFSALTDAEVMLELRAGNMAAFDVLLAKYRKPIIHFMFRMVHNQAVAEELAQEVFLRVYRSRETYRAEARFSTWLYRIATNLGVNHARDTRHERSASTVK